MDQPDLYAAGPYIASLRAMPDGLNKNERKRLVRQLITVLRDYYVHLPQKCAAFAIAPVHALQILHDNDETMSDESLSLHTILRILNGLRDRHTALMLPPPWSQVVAYLPILIEQYYADEVPRYVISKKLFGFVDDAVQVGSHVTHWNGIPIQNYLSNVLGPLSQGSNPGASVQLALGNLTIRPLGYVLLPDEDWVTLSCLGVDGKPSTVSLAWKYFVNQAAGSGRSGPGSGMANHLSLGLDQRRQEVNEYVNQLYVTPEKRTRGPHAAPMRTLENILKYGPVRTAFGEVGYLRIYSFGVDDLDTFIVQMTDILKELPQDRLIVDIRNNPGGLIPAGESLVQMLSRDPIQVAPVAFRNTGAVKPFGSLPDFAQWRPSLQAMDVSAEQFSQLFGLTDVSRLPPYRYPGRSVLIVDSLCYSTCDFLAADYKDNHVGEIIGTDRRTGAGGANVWSYDVLAGYAQQTGSAGLEPLPAGMTLNVAMRRAVRTGRYNGFPIENFGVEVDRLYRLTLNDLLNANADLLNYAAGVLTPRA